MRLSRWIVISCLTAASTRASADNTTFHATAAGSVATTDNQNGSSEDPVGGAFSDVRPGFLLTYYSPRHIHELLSEVSFLYQFFEPRPQVTFRGGWKSFYLTGPRSEISTDIGGAFGQVTALQAGNNPTETLTQLLPPGRTDTRQATFAENGSWQATKGSRVFERLFSRYSTTEDSQPLMLDVTTESFEVGAAVGFDRRLKAHNFVFEGGGSYVYFDKFDPEIRQDGSRRDNQLNPRGVAVWQYDISRRWSSNVDAGAVYVQPITSLFGKKFEDPYNQGASRKPGIFPTGGLTLAYSDVWGRAQLNVRRQVTPNLLIAQNTVNSEANLTFAMPLAFLEKDSRKRNPRVVGIGSAGFARTQLIDPIMGGTEGVFNVARLDFSVAWQPSPGQTLGLRYEVTYQNGDQIGDVIVPNYLRNTFYFTFALRYPTEVQVRVPRRQNQSVRADKGDLSPVGAEPVIVDPTELLEQGGGTR